MCAGCVRGPLAPEASGVARRVPLTANPRQLPCSGHTGANPHRRDAYPHALPPRATPTPNWCYRLELLEESAESVALRLDVLRGAVRGRGARGQGRSKNRRDKHTPEQAAPRPCVRQWQSSRVVGAGRERLGLVGDLRLGRRRRLAEVEEALLRRIRHLPTTRGFGSAYSEGAKHLEGAALLHPHLTHPTPPPPAADSCRH